MVIFIIDTKQIKESSVAKKDDVKKLKKEVKARKAKIEKHEAKIKKLKKAIKNAWINTKERVIRSFSFYGVFCST